MCSVSDIPCVGTALNQISEATIGVVKREFCYLFYHKENVNNLKAKFKELGIQEEEIDRKVKSATDDAKTIKDHVVEWQKDVEQIKGEVEEFFKRYENRPSWRCFQVMQFPNVYSSFRLGREAVKKTESVTRLTVPGKELVDEEIAVPPTFEYKNNPISSIYMEFGSRENAYKKIWEALQRKEDGFAIVGIFGMPGVGKTTIMEEVSDRGKENGIFDKVARADVGQVVDIQKLQGQLASCIHLHFRPEANEKERASVLATRLKEGEKFLIILDDVWEEIPLMDLGIPYGDVSIKGCKILLTSRERDACVSNNCKDLIEIETLKKDEAWDLFKKNVGGSPIGSLDDNDIASKVCEECACLPLVIAAVGKALKGKPEKSWKDALVQLENCSLEDIKGIKQKVYACLELSFNHLHKDAKLCLLLCSLFDEDAEITIEELFRLARGSGLLNGLIKTLEDARKRVDSIVEDLKSSSLLLEGQDGTVKMHDTIRDVARSISTKDQDYAFLSKSCHAQWPRVDDYRFRKLIHLYFESDNVNFPDGLKCPDLHTLRLDCKYRSQKLPDSFFKGCTALRLLVLSVSPLPLSLEKLADLQMLVIRNCELSDISIIIQLKNLEILCLSNCHLQDVPLDLRELKHLRMLDLNNCDGIVMLQHALSSLSELEELIIPRGFKIWDEEAKEYSPIRSELSKLTRLTNLEVYLKDAQSCPDESICHNLLRFNIYVGRFYGYREESSTTRSLRVCQDNLKGGVKTLVERGEDVFLEGVNDLRNIFSNYDGQTFVDLTRLRM